MAHRGVSLEQRALCPAPDAPFPGIRRGRGADHGVGDWNERGGFRSFEQDHPAPARCAECGEPVPFETAKNQIGHQSYPDYLDFRARNHSFTDLAAFTISETVLDSGANPSRIFGYETSGNYFDVLGIHPYLGRVFHAGDERGPNSAPYVVLAYASGSRMIAE